MLDLGRMKEIAEQLYVPMVVEQHGARAGDVLRELLEFIRKFYERIVPDTRQGRITIFKALEDIPTNDIDSSGLEFLLLDSLTQLPDANLVVQTFSGGRFIVWRERDVAPDLLAQKAIVYTYRNGVEHFYAGARTAKVINPTVDFASIFAIPTFTSLRLALEKYRSQQARKCSCKILQKAFLDEKWILLREKPESTMRDSLTQFLKNTVRDAEVRPEQIVDESHPVDIKVTWFMSTKLALVEIKWMGASKSKKGNLTKRSEPRANEGAKQLADYMDANAQQAPVHTARGYLVVIDARRGKVKPNTSSITKADGMMFENSEITFNPDYHRTRDDFEVPVRMFVEPICD